MNDHKYFQVICITLASLLYAESVNVNSDHDAEQIVRIIASTSLPLRKNFSLPHRTQYNLRLCFSLTFSKRVTCKWA